MTTPDITATVVLTSCHACAAEVPVADNYCRQCGVRRLASVVTGATWQGGETRRLPNDAESDPLLSGPLVKLLTQALTVKASSLRGNRFAMRVVAILIAFPIWLLIILLSPLDAFAAARAVSNQVNSQ